MIKDTANLQYQMANLHSKLVPSPWCGLRPNSIQWSRSVGDLDQHQWPACFCSCPISGGSPRKPPSLFLPSVPMPPFRLFFSYDSFLRKNCPKNNVTFGFPLCTEWGYLSNVLIRKMKTWPFMSYFTCLKTCLWRNA